ncbi:hypothetical protein BH23GEM6_BH23GEM6_11450 [soil metagenome]
MERLRERVEALLQAVARERYALSVSEIRRSAVGATFSQASHLLGRDRISEVQRVLSGTGGQEEKRVRALLEFLVHSRATCAAYSELDQILTWEARTSLDVRERSVPLREILSVIANTEDVEERMALREARLAAIDEQTPLLEGHLARRRETVVELGYGNYVESCEVLSGIDVRGLARDGARFLADTEAEFRELLNWYLPKAAGVRAEDAVGADGLRLERSAGYDRVFGSNMIWGLQTLLAETRLDVLAHGRVKVETRRSLASGTTAAVHPLRIPDEVILQVAPAAGRAAHESFLQALGVALHHANVLSSHSVEERWLGDESVSLGMGRVFAALLRNPVLLSRFYRVSREQIGEYLRFASLLRLLRVRRDIGELQFQLALLEEPDSHETRARYTELLSAATGLRYDERGALMAAEPAFRVACRLRAEQLQVVISTHLQERFDEDWFRNPRAGDALLALFQPGQSFSASEISVQLSSQPLSFARLSSS